MYATWTANSYKINFYQGKGTSTAGTEKIGEMDVTYDSSVTLSSYSSLGATFPLSSSNGWTFAGWSTTNTGTTRNYSNSQTFTYTKDGDLNLYAVGQREFRFASGKAPTTSTGGNYQYWNPYSTSTNYVTTVTVPNATAITGWTFIGYRANDTASSQVTIEASYAGKSTAKPAPNSLTGFAFRAIYSRDVYVEYDANGGTGTMSNTTTQQYYNSGFPSDGTNSGANESTPSFTLAQNSFTRDGYSFNKWAAGSASGTQYAAGASYTGFKPGVSDTTLTKKMYATWTANKATITINKDSAAWSNSGINVALYEGSTEKFAYSAGTASGSTVVFDYTITGTTYKIYASKHDGAKTTLIDTGLTVDGGVNKTQTINYYTITRSQGAGTTLTTKWDSASGTAFTNNPVVLGNEKVTIYGKSEIASGYHGTATLKHGTTTMTATGSTFTVSAKETITSAGATANTYTVEYYQGNNSTTEGSTKFNATSSHTYGTEKALTKYSTLGGTAPTGWTFAGWSTTETGTTVAYTDEQSVSNLTATNNGTVKLYAIFKKDFTYKSGASGATTGTVTQYYNPYKTTGYLTALTLPKMTAISNWTALGYRQDTTAADKEVTASTSATGTVTPVYNDTNTTFYGVYGKTINVYSGVNKATSGTVTQYLNVNENTVSSITLSAPTAITNWNILGYRTNTSASSATSGYGVTSGTITVTPAYSTSAIKLYGVYRRQFKVSYAGNGSTSGSTTATTKWIYMNTNSSTTLTAETVTLAANGFTKTGYTFDKWRIDSTDYSAGDSYTGSLAYDASSFTVTATAQWTANTYTVEYYQGNNSTTAGSTAFTTTSSHVYGTAKALTTYATLGGTAPTGWTFAGWNTSETGTEATYTDGQSVSNLTATNGGTVKLYAIFKKDFTVKSGLNKATSGTVTQYYNPYKTTGYLTALTLPKMTAVTDWTAIGYRADTTAGAATVTASTSATGSVTPVYNATALTYYGVYSRKYAATFFSGVSKATTNKTKDSNTMYYNTNTASTPTNATFTMMAASDSTDITNWTEVGWRDDTTAGDKEYAYEATNVSVPWGTNFYSTYSRTLTISYNGNNSTSGSTSNTTKTVYMNTNSTTTSSQEVTLAANGFAKTGYTFNKWALGSATGTQYAEGAKYTAGVAYDATTFGKTMYATWTANTYTINLDANEGTIPETTGWTVTTNGDSKSSARKSVTYDGTYGTLPTPTRTGYTFNGWYNAKTVGNISIAAKSSNYNYKALAYNIQPGVTYTITMDSAAITAGTATSFRVLVYDFTSSKSLASATPNFGNNVSFTIKCPDTADVTHKLQIIIYAGINGQTANNAVTYTNIKIGSMGTTTASQFTDSSTVSYADNHEFFAIWTEKTATLTYNANGHGTAPANVTMRYSQATNAASALTADGYAFMGWNTAADGSGTAYAAGAQVKAANVIPSATTLYAQWVKKNYKNTSTNTYYETLAAAFSAVANNQTIEVQETNLTETTAPSNTKTGVKLNMNGKTVTLSGVQLTNSGSLDVYTSVNGAELKGSSTNIIKNSGTLTTNETDTKTLALKNTSTSQSARVLTNDSGKSATLNTGATLTFTAATSSYRYVVTNSGTLTIAGANLTNKDLSSSDYDCGISSSGRVVMTSGKIDTTGIGLNNTGTGTTTPAVEISGGTISTNKGSAVYHNSTGLVKVMAGTISSNTATAANNNNEGTLEISGGTISSTSYYAVQNVTTGIVTIEGGNLSSSNNHGVYNKAGGTVNISDAPTISGTSGVWNNGSGILNIEGGDITGTSAQGVRGGTGTVNISGTLEGTHITGVTYGTSVITGTATITGGTILASGGPGAYVNGGTLIIGTNETGTPSVSTTEPCIEGSTYGAYRKAGTFKFYDGKLIGSASSHAISGTVADKPVGYSVVTSTANSKETATLSDEYTITLKAGTGVSKLTLSGWTGTGTATMTNGLRYNSTLDLSTVASTLSTGYAGGVWTKTSGAGTLNGTTFTVGAGVTTLTLTATQNVVSITGTPTYGQTLTASVTTNSDGTKHYQWYYATSKNATSGTNISGATNSTYTIGTGLVGKYIGCKVTIDAGTNLSAHPGATATTQTAVAKQAVSAVTNLTITTAGYVTWTNSGNATGYQISFDNSTWTSATSGGTQYLDTLTASTGSKTVYVRALNSDTANYTTPSSSVSASATVYTANIDVGYMMGDVDLNGVITENDAQMVLKYDVGKITLTDLQLRLANVSGDDKVDGVDALDILKYIAGTGGGSTGTKEYEEYKFIGGATVAASSTKVSIYGKAANNSTDVELTNKTASTFEGLNFTKWTKTISGTTTDVTTTKTAVNNDVTLNTVYTGKTYTISFNVNGGTGSGYQTANVTATFGQPMPTISTTKPTKTGYTFNGWYDSDDALFLDGEQLDSSIQYYTANGSSARRWDKAANATLYAGWESNVYEITLNNGSATTAGTGKIYEWYNIGYLSNNYTDIGDLMTEESNPITIPAKTGYVFLGYYTAATGGTQFIDEGGHITSNASATQFTAAGTLYAQWVQAPTITRTDYNTFSYSANGAAAYYVSTTNTKPTAGTAQSTFELNKWTTATSTGDLSLASGQVYYVWAESAASTSGTVGNSASIAVRQMKRSQYTGATLYTGIDGTDASNAGTSTTTTTYVLSGTPVWATATLAAGYSHPQLLTGSTVVAETTTGTVASAKIVITANTTIKSNATFVGSTSASAVNGIVITRTDFNTFSYSADGGAAAYVSTSNTTPAAGTRQTTFALDKWTTKSSTGNLTLAENTTYYVWVENANSTSATVIGPATISVVKATRSQGTGTTLTTRYDSTSSSTGTAFTTSDKLVLAGTPIWAKAVATTGYQSVTLKHGSTSISDPATGGTFNLTTSETIASTASPKVLTITLDKQSGTGGTNSIYEKYATGYYTNSGCTTQMTTGANKITAPTRTGYIFAGYYTAASGGTQYIDADGYIIENNASTTFFSDNGSLYAHWTERTATLSYDANGHGTAPASVTMKYSEATNAASAITADGYTFTGWNTAANGTGTSYAAGAQVKAANVVPSDTTLYAQWIRNNYKNTSTNAYYETLAAAFSAVANNQTIEVQNTNLTETTAPSNTKTGVKLNMNGKTVTLSGVKLTNSGSLDIYTSANGAVLQGSATYLIQNSGTLTTNNTSSSYTLSLINTASSVSARVLTNDVNKTATLYTNTTLKHTNNASSDKYVITNEGLLNILGATIEYKVNDSTSNENGIINIGSDARIAMSSGCINTNGCCIWNNSGTYINPPAIVISGGTFMGVNSTIGSMAAGKIVISGGTFNKCISNQNDNCIIDIDNVDITSSGECVNNYGSGTINIAGGTFLTTGGGMTITNEGTGTINITGGTIENTYGTNSRAIYGSTKSGIINITGGTISGTGSGVSAWGGEIRIGTDDSSVSTEEPSITGGKYGVYFGNSPTFKFYDGKIVGQTSITGATPIVPTGYRVLKTTADSKETAILSNIHTITLNNQSATTAGTTTIYEKYNTGFYTDSGCTTQMTTSANPITRPVKTNYEFMGYYTATNGGGTKYIDEYGKLTSSASTTNFTANGTLYAYWVASKWKNDTTTDYYSTLERAFNKAASGDTISLQSSYTDSSTATLDGNKTIAMKIGSYTLTKTTAKISIAAGSTLKVGGTGTITTSGAIQVFENSGTLKIGETNSFTGTLSHTGTEDYSVIHNLGTLNISTNANLVSNFNGISNPGTATLSSGTITADGHAVHNNGTLTISGATLYGNNAASSTSSALVNLEGKTVTMTSGTIEGINAAAVSNYGTFTASGGTIQTASSSSAVVNQETGVLTISGATVSSSGSGGSAIENQNASKTTTTAPAVKITSGTIESATTSPTISNKAAGMIYVTGGTINMTSSSSCIGNYAANAKLYISGGTFTASGTNSWGVNNSAAGTVTITGGTYTAAGTRVVSNGSSGSISISGSNTTITKSTSASGEHVAVYNASTGSITITNCQKISYSGPGGYAVKNASTGKISISGGTFESSYTCVWQAGTGRTTDTAVNISGGTFTGGGAATIKNTAAGYLYISGGTINGSTKTVEILPPNNNMECRVYMSGGTINGGNIGAVLIGVGASYSNAWFEMSGGTIKGSNTSHTVKIAKGGILQMKNSNAKIQGPTSGAYSAIYTDDNNTATRIHINKGTVYSSGTQPTIRANGSSYVNVGADAGTTASDSDPQIYNNNSTGAEAIYLEDSAGATIYTGYVWSDKSYAVTVGADCNLVTGHSTNRSNVNYPKLQSKAKQTVNTSAYGNPSHTGKWTAFIGYFYGASQPITHYGPSGPTLGNYGASLESGSGYKYVYYKHNIEFIHTATPNTPTLGGNSVSVSGGSYTFYVPEGVLITKSGTQGNVSYSSTFSGTYTDITSTLDTTGSSGGYFVKVSGMGVGATFTSSDGAATPTIVDNRDAYKHTARWMMNNGTTNQYTQTTFKCGVLLTAPSTAPTRSGYTFKGWNTNSSATSGTSAGGTIGYVFDDVTYYAIWQKN